MTPSHDPVCRPRVHIARVACAVVAAAYLTIVGVGHPTMAVAQTYEDQITASVRQLRIGNPSQRTDAARFLIESGTRSIPPLIDELKKLAPAARNPSGADLSYLVSITDVLRTVIASNSNAHVVFRENDNDEATIQALTWSARNEPTRTLRVNAAYVLASVVDNSNVCIVLDHLRDPELKFRPAVMNLLQVVEVVAGFAYEENVKLINETLAIVKKSVGDSPRFADIERRLKESKRQTISMKGDVPRTFCPNPGLAPLKN